MKLPLYRPEGNFRVFPIGDLGTRTPGEELWLARKAAGLTSYEAAARAGVGRGRYRDAERDRNPALDPLKTGLRRVSRPSLALLLALARRRSGLGLNLVAELVGVSKVTLHAREGRVDAGLRAFWEGRGFWFPLG